MLKKKDEKNLPFEKAKRRNYSYSPIRKQKLLIKKYY